MNLAILLAFFFSRSSCSKNIELFLGISKLLEKSFNNLFFVSSGILNSAVLFKIFTINAP